MNNKQSDHDTQSRTQSMRVNTETSCEDNFIPLRVVP